MHHFWHLVHIGLAHALLDLAGAFFEWSARRYYRPGCPRICGTVEPDEVNGDEPTILRFPLRPPDGGC